MWFRERARHGQLDDPDVRVRTLLWLWILVIVGFFSLSAAKQDLYIFPIVPGGCGARRHGDRARARSGTTHGAPSIRVMAIGDGRRC